MIAARVEYLDSISHKRDVLRGYATSLDDLADRFKTFQANNFEGVTRYTIEDWLMQFESDVLPSAMTVLQNVRYWNRAAFTDALSEGIQRTYPQEPEEHQVQLLPISGPRTSGHHLTYYLDDVKKMLGNKYVLTVLESAAHVIPNRPLLLYEDNIGLGRQPGTVIQQWFGIAREQWLVSEEHVEALSTEQQRAIRSCRVGLLFVTGSRKGLATLESTVRTVVGCDDLSSFIVSPTDISCFQAAARVFRNRADAQLAETAFRNAGLLALSDQKDTWSLQRIHESALGYGNAAQLTVFDYNTPVTTLTALWKGCSVPGASWTALFPRRKRE
jgi:hypothetical protein